MKKITLIIFLLVTTSLLAVTDRNMKMKMELDKSNPNLIIINIVPESIEEYERLKEIIEQKEKKILVELPEEKDKEEEKESEPKK